MCVCVCARAETQYTFRCLVSMCTIRVVEFFSFHCNLAAVELFQFGSVLFSPKNFLCNREWVFESFLFFLVIVSNCFSRFYFISLPTLRAYLLPVRPIVSCCLPSSSPSPSSSSSSCYCSFALAMACAEMLQFEHRKR